MRKLPTSIEILGNTITVEHIPDMSMYGDRYADWQQSKNLIRVQATGYEVPNEVCFTAFSHEVIHAVLDLTGYTKISEFEALVEALGQGIYQAEKTRRYG